MALITLTKATKEKSKLKMALPGLSGAGKTYSALRIASELCPGGNILLFDTEGESAKKYAHIFNFFHQVVDNHDPRHLIALLKEVPEIKDETGNPIDVVVIDSMSHFWWRLLEMVDGDLSVNKNGKKDTYSTGWNKATPIHRQLFQTIIRAPYHIFATFRMKSDSSIVDGKVIKLGTAIDARRQCEYEFDMVGEMELDNTLSIEKTRCEFLPIKTKFFQPGKELADKLNEWLNMGVEPAPRVSSPSATSQEAGTEAKREGVDTSPPPAPPAAPNEPALEDYVKPVTDEQWSTMLQAGRALGKDNGKIFKEVAAHFKIEKVSSLRQSLNQHQAWCATIDYLNGAHATWAP